MHVLNLIIKSSEENKYVVVGDSADARTQPQQWRIPSTPNEYGALNTEEVARRYLKDHFSMNDASVVSIDKNSRVMTLEVMRDTFEHPVVQIEEDDPEDAFEHRKFIDAVAFTKILKQCIYVEPSTESVKPYLMEYLRILIAEAKTLSEHELLFGEGVAIASDICGSLAHQDADEGIENDGWFKSEPLLEKVLTISGVLDADTNNIDAWQELFTVTEAL